MSPLKGTVLAAVACLLHPAPTTAQPSQAAKPGQSCQGFHDGCHTWCRQNTSDAAACGQECEDRQRTCLGDGTWLLKQEAITVFGLPAKPGEKPVEPRGN